MSLTYPNNTIIDLSSSLVRSISNTSTYTSSTGFLHLSGTYSVSASLLGLSLHTAFPILVQPATPANISVYGPGAAQATLGTTAFFNINVYDAYGNLNPTSAISISVCNFSLSLSLFGLMENIQFFREEETRSI